MTEAHPAATSGPRGRRSLLAVMCVGMFLVQLDVTVVNVALPQIRDRIGTDLAGQQWVVDGYAIVLASLLLAGGAAGDRWGHKRLVLAGLAVFGVASLVCGAAPNIAVLVGGRALQTVQHHRAFVAGLMLLPLFAPLAALAPVAGRLAGRYGPRAPMTAGLLLGAAFVGGLHVLGAGGCVLWLAAVALTWLTIGAERSSVG